MIFFRPTFASASPSRSGGGRRRPSWPFIYSSRIPTAVSSAAAPSYRWNSLGFHIQTGNNDDFLSLDFGPVKCASLSLRELNGASLKEFGVMDAAERLRSYRRYVYEAGGLKRADGRSSATVDEKILEKERKTDFEISRLRRFRYRTRYF